MPFEPAFHSPARFKSRYRNRGGAINRLGTDEGNVHLILDEEWISCPFPFWIMFTTPFSKVAKKLAYKYRQISEQTWWGRSPDLALCLFFVNTRLSLCIYRRKSVCSRPLSCRKMSGKQTDYSRRFSTHSLCCGNSPQIVKNNLRYVCYIPESVYNIIQPCRCKGSFEKHCSKKSRQCFFSIVWHFLPRTERVKATKPCLFYIDTKLVFHFLH